MNNYSAKDQKYIWHPFSSLVNPDPPLVITSAKGIYLHTEDGKKIIDGISSWWVNLHGHSNEHIANAVAQQANTLEHVIFAGFTHPQAIDLAEGLLEILPSNQKKIFYSDNGSTAVEVALKMAIQFWTNKGITKNKIIALKGAYHGDTFGAMSVGERGPFVKAFLPFLFEVEYLDFPEKENETVIIDQLKKIIKKDETAAFIFEPLLQGASGMRMYSPYILDQLIALAQENEIICIADEVLTGFGRTGKYFASDYLKNKPDIFCLSKGLTGGTMALGVTSCAEKIIEAFRTEDILKTFFHGHSFTANPIACAAANASLKLLKEPNCWNNIELINSTHLTFLRKIKNNPKINDIRLLGTVLAIELHTAEETSYFNKARNYLYQFFLKRDILLRPLGNVIYILPPLVIKPQELMIIYDAVEDLLQEW